VPISFWSDGTRLAECLVRAFKDVDESNNYVTFRLLEKEYQVVDRYTGATQTVHGLSGVYAFRGGNDPIPADPYCADPAHSKGLPAATCTANLTFAGDNLDYVAVSNAPCAGDNGLNPTCGKPLIYLAVPSIAP
jgi:hypothetical protein